MRSHIRQVANAVGIGLLLAVGGCASCFGNASCLLPASALDFPGLLGNRILMCNRETVAR